MPRFARSACAVRSTPHHPSRLVSVCIFQIYGQLGAVQLPQSGPPLLKTVAVGVSG